MDGSGPKAPTEPNHLPARLHTALNALLLLGPIALFLAATAFGMLEVHSSTDTWIGLAAGRQILTSDEFPKTDTFSYTFQGEVWYNQNWLTHLFQYCLYTYISPNAVIYGTWALSASVFVFTLLAAYWRSGTWVGALLVASAVGLGCRDFLSARPATTGFFCIAALWALICAIEGQREKRRWWPIVLLLPLLLVWGNAHGSFVFGYGVLGLYIGHWLLLRTIRSLCAPVFQPHLAASDRQVAVIVGVMAAGALLTLVVGPFGMHNFTHGQKVAGSSVFRQVSEWNPPFARDPQTLRRTLKPDLSSSSFPPMARFWTILRSTMGLLAAGVVVWVVTRVVKRSTSRPPPVRRRGKKKPPAARAKPGPTNAPAGSGLHLSLFDLAVVIIGLAMTFWARRFAPIFYIFAAPVILTWLVRLLQPLPRVVRQYAPYGLMIGAGVCACFVGYDTWKRADKGLIKAFANRPQFDLLARVTGFDQTPRDAISFVKNNNLNVNIVTEWTQAGVVMFHAPNAKVFMDGRAQQVYTEEHYQKYAWLLVSPNTPAAYRMHILDESDSDAVLLRRYARVAPLWLALEQSGQWVPVLLSSRDGLFLRRGSRGLEQLGELLSGGEEWRPRTAAAMVARGFVWEALASPRLEEAVQCWNSALEQDPLLGTTVFGPLTAALLELGRQDEARRLVQDYYRRIKLSGRQLQQNRRQELLRVLDGCWAEIESAARAAPPTSAPGAGQGD